MLAQDLQMWAVNIYYLIGLLIFLCFCSVGLIAIYIGIRMWMFRVRQNHSMAEYYRRTRRADGKMYPPVMGGQCETCKQIRTKIYHLKSGERLCIDCYEPFWRKAENWTDPAEKPADKTPPVESTSAETKS